MFSYKYLPLSTELFHVIIFSIMIDLRFKIGNGQYLNISHTPTPQYIAANLKNPNVVTYLGLIRSVFSSHITSFWQDNIFMFCWEGSLRKEDASDKLVVMNTFGDTNNLMHPRKCSECLVFVFEESYSFVWKKIVIKSNRKQLKFSKNESTFWIRAFWNYLYEDWEYIQTMSDRLSSVLYCQME
jgi:hypothetical protein